MLVWLSVWSEVQIVCVLSSWCHCIPKLHHLLPHLNLDWCHPLPASLVCPGKEAVKRAQQCERQTDPCWRGRTCWTVCRGVDRTVTGTCGVVAAARPSEDATSPTGLSDYPASDRWNCTQPPTDIHSHTDNINISVNSSGFTQHVVAKPLMNSHTRLTALCPGLPGWAGTRTVKSMWILLKQETVSGSGISWAVCKSAPRSRLTTMPAPHHSGFYRPDALPAAQPTASKHWRH